MKKVLAIGSVLFSIVFLAGCSQQPVSPTQSIAPDSGVQMPAQPNESGIFSDNTLGYEIKYPTHWVHSKVDNMLLVGPQDASVNVVIRKYEGFNPNDLDTYVKSTKAEMTADGGKISKNEDFVYKFSDGTITKGKQFIVESSADGIVSKAWVIAIVNGKNLFTFLYTGDDKNYTTNYSIAVNILNSWKITK